MNYLAATNGSFDPVANFPNICVEGASSLRYQGVPNLDGRTQCGVGGSIYGGEWAIGGLTGLYMITMYPGHGLCGGDSGSYIRRPDYLGAAYNGGTVSGHSQQGIAIGGCHQSVHGSWDIVYLTTFWKSHLYFQFALERQIWAKTW